MRNQQRLYSEQLEGRKKMFKFWSDIDETRPFPDWKSRIDNYPDADYSDCR